MTARDYELIYQALRKAAPQGTHSAACKELAQALKERNPKFDIERFLRDCGAL